MLGLGEMTCIFVRCRTLSLLGLILAVSVSGVARAASGDPCGRYLSKDEIASVVVNARNALVAGTPGRAIRALEVFTGPVVCTRTPVSAVWIASIRYLEAISAWYLGDQARTKRAFEEAFIASPALQWDDELVRTDRIPALYRQFLKARVSSRGSPPARFRVVRGGTDRQVYINGLAYSVNKTEVREASPGVYLVQFPRGKERFVGIWVTFPAGAEVFVERPRGGWPTRTGSRLGNQHG